MTLTIVSPQRTYALIVGIDKYKAGPDWNLDGPVNDARNFANWLCSRQVPSENIFLFLSPLDKNSELASPRFKEQEALHQNIYHTITDVLPQKKGDLLYIFWGGHGIITAEGERRLFYADATQNNRLNLDLMSLLFSLRSKFLPSFSRQIYIVDACANYVADPHLPSMPSERFPGGPPRKGCEQFVLLAAKTGEVAKNSSTRKTGLFSEAIMEELAQAADNSWPPNMEKLANNLKNRFNRLHQEGSVQQTPTYIWFRDWDEQEDFIKKENFRKPPVRLSFRTLLFASVVVTSILIGIRQTGILQPLELQAFDLLIRQRSDQKADPRLLLVTVTDTDIQNRKESELSGHTLAQLLEKLELYEPRVIGLDIFRDILVSSDLTPHLLSPRLIAICGVSDKYNPGDKDKHGISPPREIPLERLGFSDLVVDDDGTLRRQLLSMTPNPASPCITTSAFSFQLASYYLGQEGIQLKLTSDEYLQIGATVFKSLSADSGGYRNLDSRGYQVLLNYRSRDRIANQVTLTEVLEGKLDPHWVKDRIVIIGYSAPSKKDSFNTPFTTKYQQSQQMPGVVVHAQMVSQILSAVLDGRPLLSVWPDLAEDVWIWIWAFVGGAIACGFGWPVLLRPGLVVVRLVLVGGAVVILYELCFVMLAQGSCWIPLVPSALALVAGASVVVAYTTFQTQR